LLARLDLAVAEAGIRTDEVNAIKQQPKK